MTLKLVIDACSAGLFFAEHVGGGAGIHCEAMNCIKENGCKIVFDAGGLIEHQWLATANHKNAHLSLQDWIADSQQQGLIVFVDVKKDDGLRKKLAHLGLPSKDHIVVFAATSGGCRMLVSEDIDFYDPTLKKADSKTKLKCRERSSGCVAKFLKRDHDVLVCLMRKCSEYLN